MATNKLNQSPLDNAEGKSDFSSLSDNHAGISFGIEIEFSLATLPLRKGDPHRDGRQVSKIIGSRGPPIPQGSKYVRPPSPFSDDFAAPRVQNPTVQVEITIRDAINKRLLAERRAISDRADIPENTPPDLSVWVVTEDASVGDPGTEGKDYLWFPVELQSPAFIYSERAIQEVQAVCLGLRDRFRIYTGGGSIHVHVGFQRAGYSLRELRNVFSILWTFEEQIYQLIPQERRVDRHCQKLRSKSRLFKDAILEHQISAPQVPSFGLNMIWEATSINELVRMVVTEFSDRLGFNAANLFKLHFEEPGPNDNGNKATIEFRLHHGSLDHEAIEHWITFCCRLVMFATLVQDEPLIQWLRGHAENPNDASDFGVIDLLEALKMPEQAKYYEGVLQRRQEEERERDEERRRAVQRRMKEVMKQRMGYEEDSEEEFPMRPRRNNRVL